jgi:hypothetical protein
MHRIDRYYYLAAEIKESNKIKFIHMECCSAESIKRNLLSYAENQINFYQDIIHLVNDTSLEEINNIETKYGTYGEISQGIQIDRDRYVSALISELKGKI